MTGRAAGGSATTRRASRANASTSPRSADTRSTRSAATSVRRPGLSATCTRQRWRREPMARTAIVRSRASSASPMQTSWWTSTTTRSSTANTARLRGSRCRLAPPSTSSAAGARLRRSSPTRGCTRTCRSVHRSHRHGARRRDRQRRGEPRALGGDDRAAGGWILGRELVPRRDARLDEDRPRRRDLDFRVVGYEDNGDDTLSGGEPLPVCASEIDNGWVLTFNNRLDPDPAVTASCGAGYVTQCVSEPQTEILSVRVGGVEVSECGTVDRNAADLLEVDFIASDSAGYLAHYGLSAHWGNSHVHALYDVAAIAAGAPSRCSRATARARPTARHSARQRSRPTGWAARCASASRSATRSRCRAATS